MPPAMEPFTPTSTLALPARAPVVEAPCSCVRIAAVAALGEPRRAAHGHAKPVDCSLDSLPQSLLDALGEVELEALPLRVVDQRLRERMRGELIDGCRKAKQLLRVDAVERHHPLHLGAAERERPRLVQKHGRDCSKSLDHATALDDHPGARRSGDAGDQRHGRCEDQRARRSHDEDSQRAHGIAGDRPGERCDEQGDGQEDDGVAVGETHERRPLGLHLTHEAHERGVRALGCGADRTGLEGVPGVRRPAAHRPALRVRNRQRLPGQRRLVHDGLPGDDDAVDGNHLARADDDDIPDGDLVDGHLGNACLATHVRDPGSTLHEHRQLAARATVGPILEPIATGEHQRHDSARGVLPERQGTRHRDERDRVHTDVASKERAQGPTTREAGASGPPWPPRARRPRAHSRPGGAARPHTPSRARRGRAPSASRLPGLGAGDRLRPPGTNPCVDCDAAVADAHDGVEVELGQLRSCPGRAATAEHEICQRHRIRRRRPRRAATSRPAFPVWTSSSASASVSGAMRNCAWPISSVNTPAGAEGDQRAEDRILHASLSNCHHHWSDDGGMIRATALSDLGLLSRREAQSGKPHLDCSLYLPCRP